MDGKGKADKGGSSDKRTRRVVPENYLEDKVVDIRRHIERVAVLGKDQEVTDEVYEEMV